MKKLSLVAVAFALVACQPDTKNLEKKIDDMAKDVRELKAQIAKGGGGAGAAGQQAQQRQEADPAAVFAVDVAPNLTIGMVEGPKQAMVTLVEAWDFA